MLLNWGSQIYYVLNQAEFIVGGRTWCHESIRKTSGQV